MPLSDFQILSKLGKGVYSSVYKVKRIIDNQIYALKLVKLTNLSQKQKQNALNQAIILASISHPNIIGYRQAFINQESQSLCIIMQYAEKGDLLTKILKHKEQNTTFSEEQIWKIMNSILSALKKLHELKIIHRDLKNANIFITSKNQYKIGDLNVSKLSNDGLCRTQTGTPFYASPQIWKDQPYNSKCDIWSLGCIIYQLATLKPPFNGQDMQDLFKSIIRGIYQKIPSHFSTDLNDMIRMMLQTNMNIRPTSQKLINCSIMKKRIKSNQGQLKQQQNEQIYLKLLLVDKSLFKRKNIKLITEHLPEPNYTRSRVKTEQEIYFSKQKNHQLNHRASLNKSKLNNVPKSVLISPQRTQKMIDRSQRKSNNILANQISKKLQKLNSKGINVIKQARKQISELYNNNKQEYHKSPLNLSLIFTQQDLRKQKIRLRLKNMKNQIINIKRIQKKQNHIEYKEYQNLLEKIRQIKIKR